MNTLYRKDTIPSDFGFIADNPIRTIQNGYDVGDMVIYDEIASTTIDYLTDPPTITHTYTGRILIDRIVHKADGITKAQTVFRGIEE